ncbi:MAG: isoprenyl transferase [Crocinitomicaceae bacterium]|jgi:undecaprenyl diphosphate synthase|nr:isoprenyl transferase [Crocinitomicaceae bacterium]
MSVFSDIDLTNVPKHIAIIMDGNGRWAKKQGQMRLHGHSVGVESVRGTLKAAQKMGVKYLTLYAFSTENWNRPKEEVDGLMKLLVQSISNEVEELNESGVRMLNIGDNSQLPVDAQEELESAMKRTEHNDNIHLVLALNYSSRWEITRAMTEIAQDVKDNKLDPSAINDEVVSSYMATAKSGIPDPELLIRTSGEYRISNFLLWQIAYTEFHFTDILWPDFRDEDLFKAVLDYQSRERRFGQITEQLK